MKTQRERNAGPTYLRSGTERCPLCNGSLIRERRRIVDRLQSLVMPLKRYRCDNFGCQWVGNLARNGAARAASGVTQDIESQDGPDAPTRDVPTSFIVHMVLVAAGAVFVVVYSTMEPTPRLEENDSALGTYFYEPIPKQPAHVADSR